MGVASQGEQSIQMGITRIEVHIWESIAHIIQRLIAENLIHEIRNFFMFY